MKSSVRNLLLGVLMLSLSVLSLSAPSAAQIGIGISVRIGPPALPVYAQPVCPGPGYLWAPGYWSWNEDGGYYWVPGTWVVGPVGMLWTPGYWGFAGGLYGWHGGYWGPHVGFYGGINYGFGYGGVGFGGGEWRGGAFFYNRAVMNVNVVNVRNVYSKTVVVNNVHTSFNGPGGIEAHATAQEEAYSHEHHTEGLTAQREHEHAASQSRALRASENHGRPEIAATGRPGEFSGHNVVAARAAGAAYHEPANSARDAHSQASENRGSNRGSEAARNNARNDRPAQRENTREVRTNNSENREQQSHAANREQPSHAENRPAAAHKEQSKPQKPAPAKAEHVAKAEPKHGRER